VEEIELVMECKDLCIYGCKKVCIFWTQTNRQKEESITPQFRRVVISVVFILIQLRNHCWSRSYGSWIYNYLCNQCLSPVMLWVRISIRARCTTLCDKVCQWFATGRWFSPGPPVSSTNKTDRHDITEILLKVALNTTKQTQAGA
jgi:hypothetical protein